MITSVLLLSCDCTQHKTHMVSEKKSTISSYIRSHIHGSDLHLVLVEMLLDDLISPGHLPQETRKHRIGEFLAENRRHKISCDVAVSVSLSSHCTV